jgi:hypothetical protein
MENFPYFDLNSEDSEAIGVEFERRNSPLPHLPATCSCSCIHSRYFFGRIRAVEVRPQKFRANFFRVGRILSIVQPKNLLIWENFAQIERNSPEIFGAKLNCADSPISGEKNNYCVDHPDLIDFCKFLRKCQSLNILPDPKID